MEKFDLINLVKTGQVSIELYFAICLGLCLLFISYLLNNRHNIFYHNFFYLAIIFVMSFSFFIASLLNIKIFLNVEMNIFIRIFIMVISLLLMFISIKSVFEKYYIRDNSLIIIRNFKKREINIQNIYRIIYDYKGDSDGFFKICLTNNENIVISHSIKNLDKLMEIIKRKNPQILYDIKDKNILSNILRICFDTIFNFFCFVVFVYFLLYVIVILKNLFA